MSTCAARTAEGPWHGEFANFRRSAALRINCGMALVNQFLTQYFINYNLKSHWFLTEAPIITADWMAPAHNRWVVPFGAGFGKLSRIASQPIVWQLNLYYNVIRPQNIPAPKWQVRLQVAFLFPKEK